MTPHINYSSIEQFKNLLKNLKKLRDIPTQMKFKGTIKLHGTNASVCYDEFNGLWVQSRNSVITPEEDNQGFADFVRKNKNEFVKLIDILKNINNIDTKLYTITLYGEWCGKNIQKGVALTQIDKCFVIFDAKMSKISTPSEDIKTEDMKTEDMKTDLWLEVDLKELSSEKNRIFNIYSYDTYEVTVDLDNLDKTQKQLTEFTNAVENRCPFSYYHGSDGVGEGIVWKYSYEKGKRWTFKTKGILHAVTKEKVIVPIDIEKVKSVQDFVDKVCTPNRFEQALDSLYVSDPSSPLHGKIPDKTHSIHVIKWIEKDVIKEETDTLDKSGLSHNDVISKLNSRGAVMFIQYLKNI